MLTAKRIWISFSEIRVVPVKVLQVPIYFRKDFQMLLAVKEGEM